VPAIGITGGISTGKTTFCDCLRQLLPGARFFNADHAARQLVDSDPAVRAEIRAHFGAGIYSSAGDLNRAELRAIILQSTEKKSALERILHPRIRRQWSAEAETHRQSPDFFFADIPLLYETGGEIFCDRVVVVACSPGVQLARLLERGSSARQGLGQTATALAGSRGPIGESEAMQLINSQMPQNEKIRRADHVVWNNDGRSVLAAQAENLIALWRTI
jgi:dephospho-CoA kinase